MNLLPAFVGTPEVNRVYHTDALELLKALPDASVDLIVTSPPYDNLRSYKGYSWDFERIAHQSYRVLKNGGVMVWVVGDATIDGSETLSSFEQALYFKKTVGFRVHDTMIYQKAGTPFVDSNRYSQTFEYMFVVSKDVPRVANLQRVSTVSGASSSTTSRSKDGKLSKLKYEVNKPTRTMENVWYIPTGYNHTTLDTFAYEHPAMFPESLAERHILTWSNPGDLVLDFFGGSGTTAKMARNNGRNYLTCDVSLEYCELMRKRLAQPYTPQMFLEQPVSPVMHQEGF